MIETSVIIHDNAQRTLEIAYKTLLSLGKVVEDWQKPRINTELLYASACVKKKYIFSDELGVLIFVEELHNGGCKLSITADYTAGADKSKGAILFFISDFFEEFSKNLHDPMNV